MAPTAEGGWVPNWRPQDSRLASMKAAFADGPGSKEASSATKGPKEEETMRAEFGVRFLAQFN
jgi:hypothetical protein